MLVEQINSLADTFQDLAFWVLILPTILGSMILGIERLAARRVCAVVRYWLVMLIFAQLVVGLALLSVPIMGGWPGTYAQTSMAASPSLPDATGHPYVTGPPQLRPGSDTGRPRDGLTWQGAVFVMVLLGMAITASVHTYRAVRIRRIVDRASPANRLLLDILAYCREQIGFRGHVDLRVAGRGIKPMISGWIRPVVVIPQDLGPILGSRHVRAVVLHQLARIRLGELWLSRIRILLQVVSFWNPLVWLAGRRAADLAGQAADERVLAVMGLKAGLYLPALPANRRSAMERVASIVFVLLP